MSSGISVTSALSTVNHIINAIHATPSLSIKFPTSHDAEPRDIIAEEGF